MRIQARTRTLALVAWALATPAITSAGPAAAGPAVVSSRAATGDDRPEPPEAPLIGPALERFALYAPARGHEKGAPEVLALVEWRRRRVPHGLQLQREVSFSDGGAAAGRVVHVERLTEHNARLVWREIGSASGRSLCVQWTRDAGGLLAFEWGRDGARRVTLEAWDGVVLPLYLVELARRGSATQGSYVTFDPLGRQLERIELRTTYSLARPAADEPKADGVARPLVGPWPEGTPSAPAEAVLGLTSSSAGSTRTVELRRYDGTLAGRYVFRGMDLIAFQLQEGGPTARRVSAATYSRILHGLDEAESAAR